MMAFPLQSSAAVESTTAARENSLEHAQELAVDISAAWIRALPPTQKVTAAYLTLTNHGADAITVVGGRSDIAKAVEVHTTREVDGYVRMERVKEVSVAPGQSVALEPGGMHIMLLGLARMPTVGEKVRLCLSLARGQEVCAMATTQKSQVSADAAADHSHHH